MKKALPADEQVIAQYQRTQATTCLEILYKRYVDRVYHYCLTLIQDEADAQDYTQEIFIKILTKIDTFQNRSKFSTWLFSVSHHYCIDQIRLRKQIEPAVDTETSASQLLLISEPMDTMEQQLQSLALAMNHLPADEANLLRLKYEQGLSIQQLSQQYYLTHSAVKMRLKRSREKLLALYQLAEN